MTAKPARKQVIGNVTMPKRLREREHDKHRWNSGKARIRAFCMRYGRMRKRDLQRNGGKLQRSLDRAFERLQKQKGDSSVGKYLISAKNNCKQFRPTRRRRTTTSMYTIERFERIKEKRR